LKLWIRECCTKVLWVFLLEENICEELCNPWKIVHLFPENFEEKVITRQGAKRLKEEALSSI
jgi:hypothetical protein